MGLNLVIGCHRCRERVWMFRGEESIPLTRFYRAHWQHSNSVELTDDQSDKAWGWEYPDVGEQYGVEGPPDVFTQIDKLRNESGPEKATDDIPSES